MQQRRLTKFKMQKIREECGVFGIYNSQDASALTALGLHALQHRGQEGCGIVSYDGKNFQASLPLVIIDTQQPEKLL